MKKAIIGTLILALAALMITSSYACFPGCICNGYTPGFWKHNIGVALGCSPGRYSCFRDGTRLTLSMLQEYAEIVEVTLNQAYAALSANGPGMDLIRADMANAFNYAAGFGPFPD